jgi:hypothetical protein
MKTPITLFFFFALLGSFIQAQQSQQPQPQAPPAPTQTPCSNPAPSQPQKPSWLAKKAKDLACKQNRNLCDMPTDPTEVFGTPSKPACTNAPAAAPKPQTPAPPPPPAAPAPAKPVYFCPPHSTLIAGYAYCLLPDHSTIDALPLPNTGVSSALPRAAATSLTPSKPVYVCPPKSSLVPNYPYCVYPDQTVVDAIPLTTTAPNPATAPPPAPK